MSILTETLCNCYLNGKLSRTRCLGPVDVKHHRESTVCHEHPGSRHCIFAIWAGLFLRWALEYPQ
jgi:hypothetical protein